MHCAECKKLMKVGDMTYSYGNEIICESCANQIQAIPIIILAIFVAVVIISSVITNKRQEVQFDKLMNENRSEQCTTMNQ